MRLRLVALLLFLLVLSAATNALEVEQFKMGKDRLEVRHYRGGKYPSWVEKETGADFVAVAGFYGDLLVSGKRLRCGVDYTVQQGKEIIPPLTKNRRVLAVFNDGIVRILPNSDSCKSWGRPVWALAGMTIPPQPTAKLWRQFWAVKGQNYYRVKMLGTRWSCQRTAKQWGFEAIVHMDGGSSLQPKILHPSFALVYRG